MKKSILAASLGVSVLALSAGQAFADFSITILHMNDWHSRIESINKYDSTCSADDEKEGNCFGGAARLVTAVSIQRDVLGEDNVMLLNAGDNFQGSLFYATYKGTVEADFLNIMKTDAMTIGNHEFDDGEPGLATFMQRVTFPVVSSNVLPSYKSQLAGKVKPSVIIEKGGEKIAVIGAVANDTDELSSPGDQVLIAQDVAAIAAEAQRLTDEGVSRIIALTHVGYPRDLEAIAKIPHVDVVVGGHSHTYLANGDDKAAGPYPTMVDNPGGYQVPVVQAGAYSKYLGKLQVTWNDEGVVTKATGNPLLLDAFFEPDQASLDKIAKLAEPIEALKKKPVADATDAIEGDRKVCRVMECSMGNLVADAMLERVRDQGIQIAIQNGGGLRASIDAGQITMGEVLTVLPFQNTLSTFQLKGADVVAALENGVSQVEEGAGRFPQVAGLRFTWDPEAEPGRRILEVEVREADGWAKLDPEKTYGVVSNNFMRAGGDGYKVFASNGMNAYDYGPGLEQVVADYLDANSPYKPLADDGRIAKAEPAMAEKPAEDAAMAEDKPAEEMAKADDKPAETAEAKDDAAMSGSKEKSDDASTGMAKADDGTAMPEAKPADAMAKADDTMAKAEEKSGDMAMNEKTHVIAAGDNFWNLAKTFYGDASKWKLLAEANPEKAAKGLQIGDEITVPAAN